MPRQARADSLGPPSGCRDGGAGMIRVMGNVAALPRAVALLKHGRHGEEDVRPPVAPGLRVGRV